MCYSLPTPDDPFLNKRKHRKGSDPFQADRLVESVDELPTSDNDTERRFEKRLKNANGVIGDSIKKSPARSNLKAQVDGSHKGDVKSSSVRPLEKVVWGPSLDRVLSEAKGKAGDASSAAERAFQLAVSSIFEVRDSDGSSMGSSAPAVGEFERQWWQACARGVGVLGTGSGISCVQAYVVGAAPHIAVQRKLYGSTQVPIALVLVKSKEQALSVSLCILT